MKLKTDQTEPRLGDQDSDIVLIAEAEGLLLLEVCVTCLNFIMRLVLTRMVSLQSVGLYFFGMTVMETSKAFVTIGLVSLYLSCMVKMMCVR